jgi:hypothetical protein
MRNYNTQTYEVIYRLIPEEIGFPGYVFFEAHFFDLFASELFPNNGNHMGKLQPNVFDSHSNFKLNPSEKSIL